MTTRRLPMILSLLNPTPSPLNRALSLLKTIRVGGPRG